LMYCKVLFFIKEENFDRVQSYLDEQIHRSPRAYVPNFWKALYTQYYLHEPLNALSYYQVALDNISRYKKRLAFYFVTRRYADVETLLHQTIEAYITANKPQNALWLIYKTRLKVWGDIDLQAMLIYFNICTGNLEIAQKKCLAALNRKPYRGNAADYWMLLGLAQLKQGKLDDSLHSINQALEFDSELDEARNILGSLQMQKKDWASAVQTYQKILFINPFDFKSWKNKGDCHFQIGELDLAKESYEKAVSLNPFEADAWVDLGWIYYHRGEYLLAESACKKGLSYKYLAQEKRLIGEDTLNLISNAS
jgi:tetratricopeptide (TPR) repeat protein